MEITETELKQLKDKLNEELSLLEKGLSSIGHRNPDNPKDWEPSPEDLNPTGADANERADSVEEFEINTATLKQLEIRFNRVKNALEKMEKGTYGIDEVDGSPIPSERLFANPAAQTKIENIDKLKGF